VPWLRAVEWLAMASICHGTLLRAVEWLAMASICHGLSACLYRFLRL